MPCNKILRCMVFLLLCLVTSSVTFAQNRTIRGVITDEQDIPVIGASVTVIGTKRGTATDVDGNFSIEAASGDKLAISCIGYEKREVQVGNSPMNIILQEDKQLLDEVVVVGYGTQKKATLTGAVSAVSSKDITVTKNENVLNMLTGKIPGVRITQASSRPGAFDSRIDIRGMGNPLVIIDGVPRDVDYFSRMDANEIENVSVLKDGTAAIYGLRAANGVILVTTKRGSPEQRGFEINYSTNYGWQQFLHVPNNVDALQYMTLGNEKNWRNFESNYLNRLTPTYSDSEMEAYRNGTKQTVDWMDAIFRETAPQYQHNISVNGGTEKISYFFNLGYMKQESSLRTDAMNYDRWNFRSNVDAQITKRLKAQISVGGYMDEMNEPNTDIWAVYKGAWLQSPIADIYANNNPDYLNNYLVRDGHPLATTNSDITGYRKDVNRVFNGQLALSYDIPGIEGLTAKGMYNYDFKYTDNTDYRKMYQLYDYNPTTETYTPSDYNTPATTIRRSSYPNYKTLMQLSLNYRRTFFDDHNVSALALYEEEYSDFDNFYAKRQIFVNSEYLFAGSTQDQEGSMDKNGLWDRASKAWAGKLNYDYKGRYLAEFSFRYDGSSKFPKEKRWGFFPGGSVGWRLSEESFIKSNFSFVNNAKIRASYGKMGDDSDASNYPPNIVGYEIDANKLGWIYDGNVVGGTKPTAIPNPNLTWYTAETFDIGFDLDLWNGLIGGSFDYFQRDRDGLLKERAALIPGTVGVSLPKENLESDRTFGAEVVLTHRNKIRDFSYYVNVQMSTTRNEWRTKIAEKASNSYDNWRNRENNRYKDIWWGKTYGGQFQSYDQIANHPIPAGAGGTVPGDYYYVDWNGDGVINDKDDHPIATYGRPLINYGITLGGEWRGIDLSMHFQGADKVYVKYSESLAEPLSFNGGGTMTKFWDRWHPIDPNADIFDPSTQWVSGYYPTTGSPLAEGTRAIENASYLRLKTIELGYSIPRKWLQKAGIKDLRVYFSGYNLLTFTGLKHMDPERPGGDKPNESDRDSGGWTIDNYKYPINKTFNIGASIKF